MNTIKQIILFLAIVSSGSRVLAMEKDENLQEISFTGQDCDAYKIELTDANPSVASMMTHMPNPVDEIALALQAIENLNVQDDNLDRLEAAKLACDTVKKAKRPQSLEFNSPQQKVSNVFKRRSLGVTADEYEGKQVCNAMQKEYKKLDAKVEKEKKAKKTSRVKHGKPLSQFKHETIFE